MLNLQNIVKLNFVMFSLLNYSLDLKHPQFLNRVIVKLNGLSTVGWTSVNINLTMSNVTLPTCTFLSPVKKWNLFSRRQLENSQYVHDFTSYYDTCDQLLTRSY